MKKEIEIYKIKIKGTRPLLMHSPDSMINDGKAKSRSGVPRDPKEECKKSLYKDSDGNICIPARVIKASLIKASTSYKVPGRGKKTFKDFVRSGIVLTPTNIPFTSEWVVDIQTVVIQRSRIPRARPRFDNWEIEFSVEITDPIIRGSELKQFIVDAGKYCGICDYRPEYGLFELMSFEKGKD